MNKTEVIGFSLGALSIILWWSMVNYEKFNEARASYRAFLTNSHSLHWLSEIMSHSAFYGSFVSGLVGFEKETFFSYYASLWWLFFALYLSHTLVMRAETLRSKVRVMPVSAKELKNVQ